MSPLLLAPGSAWDRWRSVALVNDFTSYVVCQVSTFLILACGLISDACTCPASSHLSYDAGINRRRGEHRLLKPDPPRLRSCPGHSQAIKPDRGHVRVARPALGRLSAPLPGALQPSQ